MKTYNADNPAWPLVNADGKVDSNITAPPAPPAEPPLHIKAKHENIRVSPAVLDAARKEGQELLQSLRTTAAGLTQSEAEEAAERHPELWGHGRLVHRQDGYTHRGSRRASKALQRGWAGN